MNLQSVEMRFAEAVSRHQAGDHVAAEAGYRWVLEQAPLHGAAHNNLGILLHRQGRFEAAAQSYRNALASNPDYPDASNNLGSALKALGLADEALHAYANALRLKPDYAEAHYNIGNLLHERGQLAQAAQAYRRALHFRPDHLAALANLSNVLLDLGLLEDAISACRQALRLQPGYAVGHLNLGNALQEQGHLEEAIGAYLEALRLNPRLAKTHYNLANALKKSGRLDVALRAYDQALLLDPEYGQAAAQAAHLMQHMCQWDGLAVRCAALTQAIASNAPLSNGMPPFMALSLDASAALQQQCARQWSASRKLSAAAPFLGRKEAGERLRIGYLSSDFRQHALGYLMAGVFESHDRSRVEIVGYSHGVDDGSDIRRRIAAGFDRFDDVRALTSVQIADRIRADGIDILIDLNGHTEGARTAVLAERPAPVTAQFLGFAGTMGTSLVDYLIADHVVIPDDQRGFYDEQIAYLPQCYFPSDPKRPVAAAPSREAAGLPPQGIVFCSLNQSYKITPRMFALWMRLLNGVPGSVLWLQDCNRWAADNLRAQAQTAGVDPLRMVFAPQKPLDQHLARFALADLFLDSLPYNAHTTAIDALWLGVPVITCPGDTFPSRVAASFLSVLDMPQLICADLGQYEQRALELARDPQSLAALKSRLLALRGTSPLYDIDGFTRHLETLLHAMWRRYRTGLAPASISIDAHGVARDQERASG